MAIKPTERFTNRVENYQKYRPKYPVEVLEALKTAGVIRPGAVIADIGSGTGILTELLLGAGGIVFAVEPNREMREAGERLLYQHPNFRSIAGTAEETTLEGDSIDVITAGQSFHWFDAERARSEFRRILVPQGWVTLLWNDRNAAASPFLAAYEEILHRFCPDYPKVTQKQIDDEVLTNFFGHERFEKRTFEHFQMFDLDGVRGRLLSASYAPEPGHPNHGPMLEQLTAAFAASQRDGEVRFDYTTMLYFGKLSG